MHCTPAVATPHLLCLCCICAPTLHTTWHSSTQHGEQGCLHNSRQTPSCAQHLTHVHFCRSSSMTAQASRHLHQRRINPPLMRQQPSMSDTATQPADLSSMPRTAHHLCTPGINSSSSSSAAGTCLGHHLAAGQHTSSSSRGQPEVPGRSHPALVAGSTSSCKGRAATCQVRGKRE
jgi:hypothetical protein